MAQRPDTQDVRRTRIIGSILIVVLIGLRLIHLGADPPSSLWTESFGPFVDEGYKTLDARNLALFGETHWNQHDDYPGWLLRSPITQLSFLTAFKVLGQEIESARSVTVVWFLLMLLAFLSATAGVYCRKTLYLGLALLGLNFSLFAFSRLAIFEIPIALFLLLALLALKKLSRRRPFLSFMVVLLCLAVSAFGVKASALLYFLPLIAALSLHSLAKLSNRYHRLTLLLFSAVMLTCLLFFFDLWAPRLDLDFARILRESLASPVAWAHPVLAAALFLAVSQGLWEDWRGFLSSPYSLSLIAVSIGGPLLLSFFSYNPLRYYVPLLPVFVLLVLEWLELKPEGLQIQSSKTLLTKAVSGAMLFVALITIGLAFNRLFLGWIIPEQHAVPSFVAPLRFTQVFLIAAASVCLIGLTPAFGFLLRKRVTSLFVIGLLLASLLINVTAVSRALTSPSLERKRIADELEQLLPQGASLGGDWAPIFAIGTDLKALYMNGVFNAPDRVKTVRPDFLLNSDTFGMRDYLGSLAADEEVNLGSMIYESKYMDRRISVYALSYGYPAITEP